MPPESTHECEICLEKLAAPLARVSCCPKAYHAGCIRQWATSSNSCPQCRKRFHTLETLDGEGHVAAVEHVQDRFAPNPAIEEIPSQFIIGATERVPNPETTTSTSQVCVICSSSDYRRLLRGNSLNCDYCGSFFHWGCLGLAQVWSQTWFCPVCDVEQAKPESRTATGPSAVRSYADAMHWLTDESPARPKRNSRGMLIFDEDDTVFSDDDEVPVHAGPSRINGGMLRRRELWERLRLTPDERSSWEGLERLRSGSVEDTGSVPVERTDDRPARRKRKKTTHPRAEAEPVVVGTSRISSLLSQVKASSGPSVTVGTSVQVAQPTSGASSRGPSSPSPVSSRAPGPLSPPTMSPSPPYYNSAAASVTSSTPPSGHDSEGETPSLTIDHKMVIQKYIRNYLRPLYKRGGPITSEDMYVAINKRISHGVYARVQTHPRFAQLFDGDHTELRQAVDEEAAPELVAIRER
ncbi:hypothetical protein DICA0_B08064 [Diutina catenulata]